MSLSSSCHEYDFLFIPQKTYSDGNHLDNIEGLVMDIKSQVYKNKKGNYIVRVSTVMSVIYLPHNQIWPLMPFK